MKKKIIIILFFLIAFFSLSAHSGRTDAYGGHNNRKTGGYHYHNSGRKHSASNPYQNHTTCGICVEKATITRSTPTPTSTPRINENDTRKTIYTDYKTISEVQTFLKLLHYYSGNINGLLTSETKLALKKYQKDKKLLETGVIDLETKEQIDADIKEL